MTQDQSEEPFLGDPSRYVTLPVQHEKIWRKYQVTLERFWTIYDICTDDDLKQMNDNFKQEEREYLMRLLAFMYASHHSVMNKELFMQFMNQVEIKEATYYFGSQADAKKTHTMTYSIILDALLSHNNDKKERLLSDVITMPQVRDFIKWSILSTTSSSKSFSERLVAFATLQGIIFTSAFVLIDWLNKQHQSKMPGLHKSNRLIWMDEKLNFTFSCMLFEYIQDEICEEEAHRIVQEAVTHAVNIFNNALAVSSIGMDDNLMKQFIEYCADKLLTDIKASKIFNKECPFDWVDEPETDSHDAKAQTYNVVIGGGDFGEAKFNVNEDF